MSCSYHSNVPWLPYFAWWPVRGIDGRMIFGHCQRRVLVYRPSHHVDVQFRALPEPKES